MSERKIRILDDLLINQIAAGEVIENMSSVVKELVENAIDAGSKTISLITKPEYVRIIDDGCGIKEDELPLAIMRHATSKIETFHDLNSLTSLGFRGEALASIASISKLSILSAVNESGKGAFFEAHGGEEITKSLRPRRRGTTIEISSLFYNVPARKKFLRSLAREKSDIQKTLTLQALGNPTIGFRWQHQEKLQFEIESTDSLFDRIKLLLGDEYSSSLIPVEQKQGVWHFSGFIGKPSFHRVNRSGQFLFINKRAVTCPFISAKILEAYGSRLPSAKFPVFILYLNIPQEVIDVNVHPQKKEIRLRCENQLAPFVVKAVESSLEIREAPTAFSVNLPSFAKSIEPLSSFPSVFPDLIASKEIREFEKELFQLKARFLAKMGQYYLVERGGRCFCIHLGRARSRVVHESFLTPKVAKNAQQLLVPINLEFSEDEKIILLDHVKDLQDKGIGIRYFGQKTFIVDALPPHIKPEECESVMRGFIEHGSFFELKKLSLSLKNHSFSIDEAMTIVEKLFACKISDETIDGKKIYVELTEEEWDTKFF